MEEINGGEKNLVDWQRVDFGVFWFFGLLAIKTQLSFLWSHFIQYLLGTHVNVENSLLIWTISIQFDLKRNCCGLCPHWQNTFPRGNGMERKLWKESEQMHKD